MRVALCLRGAVAKKGKDFQGIGELYHDRPYIKFTEVAKSIQKHIVSINPQYRFDFFIHCWNQELEEALVDLYKPVRYCFEDNTKYTAEITQLTDKTNYSQASQALAIQKVIMLKEDYESDHKMHYDMVVLYRPDVLLWKDMPLANYAINTDVVHVNAHPNCNGDFHFVMSNEIATEFKGLYDSIKSGNKCRVHDWIKRYVVDWMHKQIVTDDIVPGRDQEVVRKIMQCCSPSIKHQLLKDYDFQMDDFT